MRLAATLSIALISLPFAAAASDNEDYERSIAESSVTCPGHSKQATTAGVRGVPVAAVRVVQQHGYVLCPDRRLDGVAVVFNPEFGVFRWNPEAPASQAALSTVVDQLTRTEEFPSELTVWGEDGATLSGQTVPAFEPKPNAPLRRFLR